MRNIILFFLFVTSSAFAEEKPLFNRDIAIGYARTALLEWSYLTTYTINKQALQQEPTILAGIDSDGTKIVMILFSTHEGSYETTFTINKDGYMERHSTGAWTYSINQLNKEFTISPFLPGP